MTYAAVIALPPFEFECDDLFVFALLHDLAGDACAINRHAVRNVVPVGVKKHIGQRDFLARLAFKQVDIDRVTFSDAILPSACPDNCESHKRELGKSRAHFHSRASFARVKPRV